MNFFPRKPSWCCGNGGCSAEGAVSQAAAGGQVLGPQPPCSAPTRPSPALRTPPPGVRGGRSPLRLQVARSDCGLIQILAPGITFVWIYTPELSTYVCTV